MRPWEEKNELLDQPILAIWSDNGLKVQWHSALLSLSHDTDMGYFILKNMYCGSIQCGSNQWCFFCFQGFFSLADVTTSEATNSLLVLKETGTGKSEWNSRHIYSLKKLPDEGRRFCDLAVLFDSEEITRSYHCPTI